MPITGSDFLMAGLITETQTMPHWATNAPWLADDLILALQIWYQDLPHPLDSCSSPEWLEAQGEVGWHGMLDGWLALPWHLEQEWYWSQIQSQKSIQHYMPKLIKKCWDVAWDMWNQHTEVLHSSPENQVNILESKVDDQIWAVYELGSLVLLCNVFCMLQALISQQLQKPLATKQQWLESIYLAMDHKLHHDHGSMTKQRIMRCFSGLD